MMKMIETEDLRKSFMVPRTRKRVEAVRGLYLSVEEGEIFGFLGPNGAGKTTMQRMLTTLLMPDSGRAVVAGHDLLREPTQVRRKIGAVSQAGGADNTATGRENLLLQAQLYGMPKKVAQDRATELIENLELTAIADRVVRTYSGGQRRRLDLALGLVHRPKLLFLDEPSLGLDPQSRIHLWDEVRALHAAGTTIFLTTHYLDEADALCDRVAIIDEGTIVAEGTPTRLKQAIAGDLVTLHIAQHDGDSTRSQDLLRAQPFVREIKSDGSTMQVYVTEGEAAIATILRLLDSAQINVRSVTLSHPSLDDVFLQHTGRSLRENNGQLS